MSEKVLAIDAKAGQWYQDASGAMWLCIKGRLMANESGCACSLLADAPMTHLPDCTGWDWQPPKPEPKYRPFATWQEWWPHRNRWMRLKHFVCQTGWEGPERAARLFDSGYVFLYEDGEEAGPFGVEVTE